MDNGAYFERVLFKRMKRTWRTDKLKRCLKRDMESYIMVLLGSGPKFKHCAVNARTDMTKEQWRETIWLFKKKLHLYILTHMLHHPHVSISCKF